MMKRSKYYSILLAGLLFSFTSYSQEEDLKTEDIEVVKEFTPLISEASKINFPPTLPDRQSEKFELLYSVPVTQLSLPFSPAPLRPLAVAKEKPEKFKNSYIKAGFGTQFSPLIELRYNDGKFEKYNYGAFFRHFSSRATKIKHQSFNDTRASVYGDYFFKNAKLHSDISYGRLADFYYGYHFVDTTLFSDTSFSKRQVKQKFNDFEWNAQISNIETKSAFNYDGQFGISYFSGGNRIDTGKIREFALRAQLDVEKIFKEKHFLRGSILEDYSVLNKDGKKNRNIFGVKALYEYNDQKWRVFGGVEGVWEVGIFHVFPDLGLERSLFKNFIILYNGWKMELSKNSYKSLTAENPYIKREFGLRNTWHEDQFMGLKGTVENFTYDVRFARKIYRHLPLYINDSTDVLQRFLVIYEKRINTLNLHCELSYKVNRSLHFNVTFDFFNFEPEVEEKAWHMPRFKFNLSARYSIKDKVFLEAELFARDGVFAKVPVTESPSGSVQLGGIFDISLGATYKFSNYLSFFCNLNNLAHIKYEKYHNYPLYGFNAMAGGILTF